MKTEREMMVEKGIVTANGRGKAPELREFVSGSGKNVPLSGYFQRSRSVSVNSRVITCGKEYKMK